MLQPLADEEAILADKWRQVCDGAERNKVKQIVTVRLNA